jgi:hypothetical protein
MEDSLIGTKTHVFKQKSDFWLMEAMIADDSVDP